MQTSRYRRHRLRDTLLRLGAPLFGEQQVFLAGSFLDVLVQPAKRILEAISLLLMGFPGELHLRSARNVLLAAHERLLGQIVAAFLDGEHRTVLPLLCLSQLLGGLIL
jgi:hypothetical protein